MHDKDILRTEYCPEFDEYRKHRMEVSYHKYGPVRDNYATGRCDAIATAELCIEAFKRDHNLEHLVDAANYMMIRFKYPMPGETFKGTDTSAGMVGTPINMEGGSIR